MKYPEIDRLVKLAEELGAEDDTLHDELDDVTQAEAKLALETLTEQSLHEQLIYLHEHYYDISRLEQLIRESVQADKEQQ